MTCLSILLISVGIVLGSSSQQSQGAEASRELITLWPGVAPGSEGYEQDEQYANAGTSHGWITQTSKPTLDVYFPPAEERVGTGVVICPGGGYSGVAIDKEGHALAKWFADRGVVAGVLKYRCGGGQHKNPVPLNDAQRVLRIMRSNAEQWKIDVDKIGIAGFSAGGHLASTAGTHFDEGDANADEALARASCRPNFMVLVYPVISMQDGVTHGGSRQNLLGKEATAELVNEFSNELQVSTDTCPTFLAHSTDDGTVPVENSLLFYAALRKHKVPAAMHIYETGGHGFGLYLGDRPADRWPDQLEGWLKQRKLIK